MNKFFYFLFFITLPLVSFSQEEELDSVKELVRTHTKRDTTRVEYLIKLTEYYTTRNVSKNFELAKEAISICKELNYTEGLGKSYAVYTTSLVQSGNYGKALEYAFLAKDIQDSLKDTKGLMVINNAISSIYINLGQSQKAIDIQLQNLNLFKSNSLNPKKASIHFYLGKAYTELKAYTEAAYHYNQAKKIAVATNFKTGVAISNSSLGILSRLKGDSKASVSYLKETLRFYKTNNQEANIAHTNMELGYSLASLNQFKEAIRTNNNAIVIYEKHSSLEKLKSAYRQQSKYYKKLNNHQKTNEYLNKYYKIKDSIFSIDKVKVIEEMQIKYETEKAIIEKQKAEKEAKIIKLESQKNKARFVFSLIIGSLLILTGLFYFNRLKSKKKAELVLLELKETQKRLALEKQYRHSELKALKAQMDPHFIFNALNSIQEYIVLNQKNLASDYLGKFADLMRKYLDHSDKGVISLQEEVTCLKMYLELEAIRFEEKLSYDILISSELSSEEVYIPTMLIQPYIENALKHGLLHKKHGGKLLVSFNKLANKPVLVCIIEDNGIGRKKAQELKKKRAIFHKSFATKATESRLNLLNFGKEQQIGVVYEDLIDTNEQPNGTRVHITIPISKA